MNEWKPKTERNQKLIKYAAAHPNMTLREIGKIFNIKTRQRVQQILRKYGSISHSDPRKVSVKQPLMQTSGVEDVNK